jgi:hypothetical protein
MNKTNTGGPAYPAPVTKPLENYYPGMTLRDYFAAKAMQSLITASVTDPGKVGPVNNISEYAYSYADAMLKAREA